MTRALALLVLLGCHSMPGSVAFGNTYEVRWAALKSAFDEYLRSPSARTAKQVTSLLPSGEADRHEGVFDVEIVEKIFERLENLQALIKRGRPEAIDVAFALTAISDGHFSEELSTMLAGALDVAPSAFLSALKRKGSRSSATCSISVDAGLDYLDDPAGELALLQRRQASLERVRERELQEEKRCLLQELDATIRIMTTSENQTPISR